MNDDSNFDPDNNFQLAQGIFGLPAKMKENGIVLIPIPWEVTVSYGAGTANAPAAIYDASSQIDLFDSFAANEWKKGIFLLGELPEIRESNVRYRPLALKIIKFLEENGNIPLTPELQAIQNEINKQSALIHDKIQTECYNRLSNTNTIVGILGGDHSCSLGLINALTQKFDSFGVLQIDAHADLRNAYEGFEFSHASAMRNILNNSSISSLTQVAVRDYSASENEFILNNSERIICFSQDKISNALYAGENWNSICERIVATLPQKVYLSFDIDGLDPSLCPSTGTPVPGGISFYEAVYLIRKIVESKRVIIGFDLCEVSPAFDENNSWDAIVGARILYQICINALKSQI